MTPQELLTKIEQSKKDIAALQVLWGYLFPDFEDPGVRQYQTWLRGWGFDITVAGMEAVVGFLNKQKPSMPSELSDFAMKAVMTMGAVDGGEAPKTYGPLNTARLCSYITGAMRKIKSGDARTE
jgi:hypothetical protein